MSAEIATSEWRLVQAGRVVLITEGPYKDHLAATVQIHDMKRVCGMNLGAIRKPGDKQRPPPQRS